MITIKDRILEALKNGDRLTGLDGLTRFGTLALRNRIGELRAEGVNIQDEMVECNGKHFKRYFIPQPFPMVIQPKVEILPDGQLTMAGCKSVD